MILLQEKNYASGAYSILLAAGYYAVIDQPIRTAINEAKSQQDELNTELMLLQTKAASLSRMQSELDSIEQSGSLGENGKPQ
ncbi:MAG: hypothetical protein ACLVBP_13415 [Ruminococcus sp.]